MKKIVCFTFILIALISCSSMSKNFTQSGEFVFDGGVFQEKKWNDNLVFKRVTWYHEFTTAFDLAFYKIDPTSPFFNWFSAEEKATVRSSKGPCFIALQYTLDSKKISPAMLKEQLKEMGADFKLFRQFYDNLANHPKSPYYSYSMFSELGMCFAHPVESLVIDLPGFQTVIIK